MKQDFSKPLVIAIVLTVLLYTAIVLLFSWHEKTVPDSLTYSFYAFFGTELFALAAIKVSKVKNNGGEN